MSDPDYRGARGANAGTEYHKLYAIRHSLSLLDQSSKLLWLTVEGLKSDDESAADPASWDGVDCALYYGTKNEVTRIIIDQLKYSSSKPDKRWTVSRLIYSSGKTVNNSVLRRLADAFVGAEARFGSSAKISIRLVTNQQVHATVQAALSRSSRPSVKQARAQLLKASGLTLNQFARFAAALDFTKTGSRFSLEKDVIDSIASWTDDDATTVLNTLLRFITQKMMPESKGESITSEQILVQFGFSSRRALFPCPTEIKRIKNPVKRSAAQDVVSLFRDGSYRICLHGNGGSGKTTALQEIADLLPNGSAMVIFDCYGAGKYLDSDAYRHRPNDAFLQICNDMAAKLRIPVMLNRGRETDYTRAFLARLERASEIVSHRGTEALLVITVDAADNSATAAASVVPPEHSFVHDFMRIGTVPSNVRFLVTARTGRLDLLQLPPTYRKAEIRGFEPLETKVYVARSLPRIPDWWITDFHQLSNGNPRVQSYALEFGAGDRVRTLDYLRPKGKELADVFENGMKEASIKNGGVSIEKFCAALIALPRPMPWPDLAHVSELSIQQVRDLCSDLAPGIRVSGNRVGFSDEDFEHFVSTAVGDHLSNATAEVARWFAGRHEHDAYAAAHIAAALHKAGCGRDVIELLEKEAVPDAIKDPLLRHEVQLGRMRIAMQVANEQNDTVDALRTILAGAEAMKTDSAIREMLVDNPDLSSAFARDSAAKVLLLDSSLIERHGHLLFHLMAEDARAGNQVLAREDWRQLQAWLRRRSEEYRQAKIDHESTYVRSWPIDAIDIAAEIEAMLLLENSKLALETLRGWSPRNIRAQVARHLVPRLINSGRSSVVQQCLDEKLIRPPWNLFLLIPLALSGANVDVKFLERILPRVHRHLRFKLSSVASDYEGNGIASYWLDIVISACEILVCRGGNRGIIVPLLESFCSEHLRSVSEFSFFKPSLIDAVFRASTLLTLITGQTFEIPIPLRNDQSGKASSKSPIDRERFDEVSSVSSAITPLYTARAKILAATLPAHDIANEFDKALASFDNQEYRFSHTHGSSRVRAKAALAILDLLMVPQIHEHSVLSWSLRLFGRWSGPFNPDLVSVLSKASLAKKLHPVVVKTTAEYADAIRAAKTTAREKVGALLRLVRLVEPISRDDARALFVAAHQITEDIDVDAIHKLKATSALAHSAKSALSRDERRTCTATFWSIATDSAIRLSEQDGFPWEQVINALSDLDLPMALAAICRWEDSGVVARETTLEILVDFALRHKSMDPAQCVALLPLLHNTSETIYLQFVEHIKGIDAHTTAKIVEELAQHELLRFGQGRRQGVAESLTLSTAYGQQGPWMKQLFNTTTYLSKSRGAYKCSSQPDQRRPSNMTSPLNTTAIPDHSYRSSVGICDAVRLARSKSNKHLPVQEVLAYLQQQVPVSDRLMYLEALSSAECDELPGYYMMRALSSALKEWQMTEAVRHWCDEQLPNLIVNRFPDAVAWLSYESQSVLPELLSMIRRSTSFIVRTLILATAKHCEQLDAATVYAVVQLIADKLSSADAKSILLVYLRRLNERIPSADLEQIDISDVPTATAAALARLFYAFLSDCDVRTRWNAAHGLRKLARLGQPDIFDEIINLYDRKEEKQFRENDAPFYWLAARLWLVIALDRIASENPSVIRKCSIRLIEIATDPKFPHVLIRGFAADAVVKLADAGFLSLTRQQRSSLSRINSSRLRRKSGSDVYRKREKRDRRFHFNSMDTIPYWYEPWVGTFADITLEDFLDRAEFWILECWKVPEDIWKWADEPRRHRFNGRNEMLALHGHGSLPLMERYSTHVEWHAMWCVIGQLLSTSPLRKHEGYFDDFEERLAREKLTCPPHWIADFRSAKPLEDRFWFRPSATADSWVKSAHEEDFLLELGIGSGRGDMLVVDGYHNTQYDSLRTRANISSALVQPETARALLRALQTAYEPYDYRLPPEGHDLEINQAPYRLLGWITETTPYDGRLDEQDPFRNTVREDRERPGKRNTESLSRHLEKDGVVRWQTVEGDVAFLHEAWSDIESLNQDNERISGVASEGKRLWVSKQALNRVLDHAKMDLIVEVAMTRRKGEKRYGNDQDKSEETIFDRV